MVFRKVVTVLFFISITWALFIHKGVGKRKHFVTSEKCRDCHKQFYKSWKEDTLHPWQFQPIDKARKTSLPLIPPGKGRTFSKDEVEFVVGNKWERVYSKKIGGEYYPLTAKWLVKKQKWVPYKVKTWKDTPMSKKCNGCHTTGFNPETLEFSEFGIGCEACHGPGSMHIQNRSKKNNRLCVICHWLGSDEYKEDIVVSVSAVVCGRCHNRGMSAKIDGYKEGEFSFPINYNADDDNINSNFVQLTPEKDKKHKYWWKDRISKNRHQEFFDWKSSKHANALKFMQEKYTKDRGKMDDYCLRCHSSDYEFSKPGKKPTIKTAKYGVTCVSCHNPHGLDKKLAYKKGDSRQCGGCHVDSMSFKTAKKGKKHYPCPITKAACADCHMPYTVKIGGEYSIRSHSFKIVTPMETQKIGIPSSCQNGICHKNKSVEWAVKEFKRFYSDYGKAYQADSRKLPTKRITAP